MGIARKQKASSEYPIGTIVRDSMFDTLPLSEGRWGIVVDSCTGYSKVIQTETIFLKVFWCEASGLSKRLDKTSPWVRAANFDIVTETELESEVQG